MILLAAVSFVVIWLRFKMAERITSWLLSGMWLTIEAHGTRTLFNGQPARQARPPVMNRAERRRRRAF